MMGLNLTDLRAVLAVGRKGSFRGAAHELGLSTSALSNAIAKVEGQLGVRLFNRTTRSVSVTEAGRRFIEQVAPAIDDIHEALDAARSRQGTPAGTLRINTFATAGREILSPLVLEFLRRFPDVRVDLVTEGNLVDIVAAGFDFGVRSATFVPSDMIAIPLGRPRHYAVVASPAYLDAHGTPLVPSDLLSHACIRTRLPDGALFRWPFEAEGRQVRIDVDGPLTLDEASLARIAVRESFGVGFFMLEDVREDIETGRLVHLLPGSTPLLPPFCLYYPNRRNPTAAFKAFVDFARAHASKDALQQ